jgi:hypothetical protein
LPPRESLLSDIPAGDGNNEKFFYDVPALTLLVATAHQNFMGNSWKRGEKVPVQEGFNFNFFLQFLKDSTGE